MSYENRQVRWWLVVAMALTVAFSFQGCRALYESSEGRYAECGREMLESGNWLIPTLDSTPHWTKPPMTYWAIASGMAALGKNEWGARLYLAIAFFLTALAVTALARKMWDGKTATVAGIVYSTSLFPALASNMVTTDALLTLWEVAAATCYWYAYSSGRGAKGRRRMTLMWTFLGLAFLTKGPPGLIVLLAIIPFQIILSKKGDESPSLLNPPGLVIFAILGFGWYLAVNHLYPGLISSLTSDEVVKRVATDKFHRNSEWYKPFVIYLPLILFGCLPWAAYWPGTYKKGIAGKSPGDVLSKIRSSPALLFLVMWAVVPLVVFSAVKSRLALYILPLMAPVAAATARAVVLSLEKGSSRKKFAYAGVAAMAFIIGLKAFASIYPDGISNMRELHIAVTEAAGGENYEVSLYKEKLLWGLQFYEGRHVDRISVKGRYWKYKNLKQKVSEIQSDTGVRHLFVVRPGKKDKLAGKLTKFGITYREVPTRTGWRILAVDSGGA